MIIINLLSNSWKVLSKNTVNMGGIILIKMILYQQKNQLKTLRLMTIINLPENFWTLLNKRITTGATITTTTNDSEAIAAFEETTNKFPSFIKAHCGLGRAYLGQDKLVAAEKSAKEALRLDDNYQLAFKLLESIKQKYCEHGRNYFNQDDLVSAEKSAKEALRLDDNYQPAFKLLDAIKQAYYNRGIVYLNNKQYESDCSL